MAKTKLPPYPEGVEVIDPGRISRQEAYAVRTATEMKRLSGKLALFFDMKDAKERVNNMEKRALALTRVKQLSGEFRMVKLDRAVRRPVRTSEGSIIKVPLIFTVTLPTKTKYTYVHRGQRRRYTVSTIVPTPPDQALDAIKEHGKKFDEVQVWWVPKDVKAVQVKERTKSKPFFADPILVGVVKAPKLKDGQDIYYFELHRWEQPDVEKAYFSHEAY